MSDKFTAVDKVKLDCKGSPSLQGPPPRLFWTSEGPKCPQKMGSKWAHFTSWCTPNGLGKCFEKCIFDPFLVRKSYYHVFLGELDPGQAPLNTLLLMPRLTEVFLSLF